MICRICRQKYEKKARPKQIFRTFALRRHMNATLLDIRRPVEAELARYTQLFDEVLTHKEGFMNQALAYVRGRKGKMMRPILVLLIAKELGEVSESALRSAVTLELLHTASLVHDDVVDESNERRGQASVHKIYDNKVAVLLGDYMLANSLHQAALTNKVAVVEHVARLGATLSEGEIFQLANVEREEISEEAYYRIIRNKTAALFATCGALGALSMDAAEDYCSKSEKLGEIIGICFQIRDDIFDYFDDAKIGKPRGNDMLEGKLTLPVIYAVNSTQDPQALNWAMRVKMHEASAEEISSLIDFTKQHGGIEYAEDVMKQLADEARDLLKDYKNQEVKASLEAYIDFVIRRDY